ncbi:DUF6708 domain-containing protein [Cupriavidus campinensis]
MMFTTSKKQRPLNNQDREWHLPIRQRRADPHASGFAIRMNSTYLELVDGLYSNRGGMSAVGIFGVSLTGAFLISLFHTVIARYLNPDWDHHDESEMLWATIICTVIVSLFITGIVAFNLKIGEWFRCTHYPLRFNRQNRKVYLFRGDDTVLEASWDDVYFTLRVNSQFAGVRSYGICGLILKDEQTVGEMFVIGFASTSLDQCRHHWEFIRRYMEEGPQSVIDAPGFQYCLPIADKRETLYQGWVALVSMDASNLILKWFMFPFHVFFFLGRLIHHATSKVPLWPADVEAACRIMPGDPYVRDSSTNPEGYR